MIRAVVLGLISYDLWCLLRILRLMVWLEEWLDISQRQTERALIVVYLALFNLNFSSVQPTTTCLCLLLGLLMWVQHRRPEATRHALLTIPACVMRALLQVLLLSPAAVRAFIAPYSWRNGLFLIAQAVYIVFLYVTHIHSNGQRGRRRKLAMEELKRLFGGWLPVPVRT